MRTKNFGRYMDALCDAVQGPPKRDEDGRTDFVEVAVAVVVALAICVAIAALARWLL